MGGGFLRRGFCNLFVDASGQVKMNRASDGVNLQEGIHPSHNGYVAMGDERVQCIERSLGPIHPGELSWSPAHLVLVVSPGSGENGLRECFPVTTGAKLVIEDV